MQLVFKSVAESPELIFRVCEVLAEGSAVEFTLKEERVEEDELRAGILSEEEVTESPELGEDKDELRAGIYTPLSEDTVEAADMELILGAGIETPLSEDIVGAEDMELLLRELDRAEVEETELTLGEVDSAETELTCRDLTASPVLAGGDFEDSYTGHR